MKNILFLITLLAFLNPFNTNAQKRAIELNLEVGETYIIKQNTSTKIIQKVENQDFNSTMSFGASYSFKVIDFSNDKYTLETKYTALSISMKVPDMTEMTLSTNDADQDGDINTPKGFFSSMANGLIDKPFIITMKKNGSIESIKGHEEMANQSFTEFIKKLPNRNAQKEKSFLSMLEKMINDESIKASFEKSLNIYPESSVTINDKWRKTIHENSLFNGYYEIDYSLTEIGDGYISIEGNGELVIPDNEEYVELNGMEVKMIMLGKWHSNYKVDLQTGWIIEASITVKSGGEMLVKPSDQLPEGMTIQMNTNGITTIN